MGFYEQALAAEQASYLRIVDTDTSSWSEADKNQHQDDLTNKLKRIKELESTIAASAGRRIHLPMRRVNI